MVHRKAECQLLALTGLSQDGAVLGSRPSKNPELLLLLKDSVSLLLMNREGNNLSSALASPSFVLILMRMLLKMCFLQEAE